MNDMMKMYAMQGMPMGDMAVEETLLLNTAHPLVQYLMTQEESETTRLIAEQLYDLAKLQQAPLGADAMAKFIERSNALLLKMTK